MAEKRKFNLMMAILGIILGIFVLTFFGLLLFAVLSTFSDKTDFERYPLVFFKSFHPENYIKAFKVLKVRSSDGLRNIMAGEMYFNAVAYSVLSALTSTIVPCVTSYMCAKYKNKFSALIETIVIVTMILPIVGNLPSALQLSQSLGLYNKITGVAIMQASFTGMYFLVFYGTFLNIPNDYGEAAEIDGASQFFVLIKVYLPLVKNMFITILLLKFITNWNDYQTPLLFMPNKPTISYGLYYLSQYSGAEYVGNYPLILSATMLVSVPMILLFLVLHKSLLKNISFGGLKV